MTPNQLVAFNLRQARLRKGWTQEETAERLEPFLGERWSKATFSVAERSVDEEGRRRVFSADEIYAFARAFELPVSFFLAPTPIEDESIAPPNATETTSRQQGLDLCFGLSEPAQDVLVGPEGRGAPEGRGVLEFSAPATEALLRWRDEYAAAAAKRQEAVEPLLRFAPENEETN